jgi:ABC-type antimicrobial peptide transport system permease subunit
VSDAGPVPRAGRARPWRGGGRRALASLRGAVFELAYIFSELRRRAGRTLLMALGLAVGVGLVVTVTALATGLDRAQSEVLRPLTGVGTDMVVSRPLRVSEDEDEGFETGPGAFLQLEPDEIRRLQRENRRAILDTASLGDPGEEFETDVFVTTTQLSFPQSETAAIADLEGVAAASPALTLTLLHLTGTVPAGGFQTGGIGPTAARQAQNINFEPSTISGVDRARPDLALVTPGEIRDGRWFDGGGDGAREAVVTESYAGRKGLLPGSRVTVKGERLEVVGIAAPPLGGTASDLYVDLPLLQELSGREDRVNVVLARAGSADAVGGAATAIRRAVPGATVTTAEDLADTVSGSLLDAQSLADGLSRALAVVALIATFLIASLLTLSAVNKRTRELGTLSAIGWSRAGIVRQVTGEALVQGALGGLIGVCLGLAGAWLIERLDTTLTATVAGDSAPSAGLFSFGRGQVVSGSSEVALTAPVSPGLLLAAVGLALAGGLIAGAVGGLRAARLRPVDALRHVG